MRLRDTAIQFISYSIANGESVSLWFEPWWGNVCLEKSTAYTIISHCGMHHNDKVSKIIVSNSWLLPTLNAWCHHLDPILDRWLRLFDFPALDSTGRDTILWDGIDVTYGTEESRYFGIRQFGTNFVSIAMLIINGSRV